MPRTMLGDIARAAGLGNFNAKARPARADAECEDQDSQDELTDEMPADPGQPNDPGAPPEELPVDPADAPEVPEQPSNIVARKGSVIGGSVVKSARSFSFVSGPSRNSAAAAAVKPAATPAAKGSEPAEAQGYIASMEARGHRLDTSARAAIVGYAKTWAGSADVRAEFGTFEVFASYMRAKDKGAVRIFGA